MEAVAGRRTSKENTEFYKTAFYSLMFQTCHTDIPQFEPEGSLEKIVVDWSDTETKRLREVVSEEVADSLLGGGRQSTLLTNMLQTGSLAVFHCISENLQLRHSLLLQNW